MNPYRTAMARPEAPPLARWPAHVALWLALGAAGCGASAHDAAVTAANVAGTVGDAAAVRLHNSCTVPYQDVETLAQAGKVTEAKAHLARLDSFCPRLAATLDAYAALHTALVALLQSEYATAEDVARVRGELLAAGAELAEALERVAGAGH
jgi:hypothetical protein